MKKVNTAIAAGTGAALLTSAAMAGQTQSVEVDVDLTAGLALGDMRTARNADDPDVRIGCGVREFDDGAGFGFCQAEDAEGDTAICITQNADLIEVIRVSSDRSFITFQFEDDGSGGLACTLIGFSNQSFYLEKTKNKKK